MAKYIDREALIEWLKRIPIIDLSDGRGLCRVIMEDDFKRAIKEMPEGIIADAVQMRHGRRDEEVKDYHPYLDYQKPYKQMTNAQKIRAMSDEELSKVIREPFCDKRTHEECTISYCGVCDQCVLDWLQQPCEGGE